eukprot:gene7912-10740_t
MPSLTILITGAAGRIGYSLIPLILSGQVFGQNTSITLKLFDIAESKDRLLGIKMEILDSNYPLLENVVASVSIEETFTQIEIAILIGGYPRLPGMERKDLILKNAESMKLQAEALNRYCNASTKVLVVANPANTNCLVAMRFAPNIPKKNFSCLTRLDEERLRGFLSEFLSEKLQIKLKPHLLKDVYILGNHSTTQVAYIKHTTHADLDVSNAVNNITQAEYDQILFKLQNRGAEIIKNLTLSSAMSAATAIGKHLSDWCNPQIDPSTTFSMGISSDNNSYGIPDDLVFSFPCRRNAMSGEVEIIPDVDIYHQNLQFLIDQTIAELMEEKDQALEILHN